MKEPLLIQLIADYGVGDPAFAEVIQKLTLLEPQVKVETINVPAFSTVATGIWLAQLATVNSFPGLVIFSNTAPRLKETETEGGILGGRLVYTQLDNGVKIIAVQTGYCFSFLRDKLTKLFAVKVANQGSQFRSRDFYPEAVISLARDETKYLGEEIPLSSIPLPPNNLIGFIDGYGNLKTTLRQSQNPFRAGTKIKITIGEVTLPALVTDETYSVADDEISFAPGSTGGEDRFMEIWVRGGNAWERFKRPKVEEKFFLSPLE